MKSVRSDVRCGYPTAADKPDAGISKLALGSVLEPSPEGSSPALDEVFVKINGETHYLWRAVDHEGGILESYVAKKRDKKAALKFLRKAQKRKGQVEKIVIHGLKSYPAAMRQLGNANRRELGRWKNNRVENSHLPFRRKELIIQRFRRMTEQQKFVSVHANVHNHFNSRPFGSIRNATSSIVRLSKRVAQLHWPSVLAVRCLTTSAQNQRPPQFAQLDKSVLALTLQRAFYCIR